ncbi:nuclear transport factor 2 family protein [Acinetobacter sp. ANC 7201]|nr:MULTISPECIES: nuclear transport factor 2 family protein [Acinetobacter]MDY6510020.1 nuclear transport factor 2 family protein [Acinetobacter faecalis]WFP96705.1 nuclear transport factor 2 family protein [Acinetobacter sp. ANC 7201]
MYAAFVEQNVEAAVETVSDDSVWIHHGTQKLPSLRFEGKAGVHQFFQANFTTLKVEYFDILNTYQQGNTIIVTGKEKFIKVEDGSILAQKWVQIYTFENGLITRMEEFASSAADEDYIVIS